MKLTPKQEAKCKVTHCALLGIANNSLWDLSINKRDITRHFYEGCASITSGYVSLDAQMAPVKDTTKDHFISPQTYAYYIMDNWHIFSDYEKFKIEWYFCSQTIKVTKEENMRLKQFTVNNDNTGGIIKVTVPIIDRYKQANIRLYHDKEPITDVFPFQPSENFIEYERKYLLI